MLCPLCAHKSLSPFFRDRRRAYFRCDQCALVFVPPEYHLSEADERAEYEKHENDPSDLRYRTFLSRIAEPLCERLASGSEGLDFGCGPGPTLSVMLEEHGHCVNLYDKYFFSDESVWQRNYGFICATEVIEHLREPGNELKKLWDALDPGGYLAVMTKLVIDQQAFSSWHYKNDQTHISFFSMHTLNWLAQLWKADLSVCASDAFIFRKSDRTS